MLYEPEIIETNLIGKLALLQGLFVESVPVDIISLESRPNFIFFLLSLLLVGMPFLFES